MRVEVKSSKFKGQVGKVLKTGNYNGKKYFIVSFPFHSLNHVFFEHEVTLTKSRVKDNLKKK